MKWKAMETEILMYVDVYAIRAVFNSVGDGRVVWYTTIQY